MAQRKKSGVKRRLGSVVDPTTKKGRATKKLSPKEKLRRRKLAIARKGRMRNGDKVFDKVRGKILHKRRTKTKVKTKKVTAKRGGKGRHKFVDQNAQPQEKKGMSTGAKIATGVGVSAATAVAVMNRKKLGEMAKKGWEGAKKFASDKFGKKAADQAKPKVSLDRSNVKRTSADNTKNIEIRNKNAADKAKQVAANRDAIQKANKAKSGKSIHQQQNTQQRWESRKQARANKSGGNKLLVHSLLMNNPRIAASRLAKAKTVASKDFGKSSKRHLFAR